MDLQQKIIDYIEVEFPRLAPISAVYLPPAKEGISITITPSSPNQRYFNGAVDDTMGLQISAKSVDSLKALKNVTDIVYLLERAPTNAITSDEGAFCFKKCEIYTNPNLAYMDANQTYVYVSLIRVYFERRYK